MYYKNKVYHILAAAMMGNDPSSDPTGGFDSALCQAAFMQPQQQSLQHPPTQNPIHPGSSLANPGPLSNSGSSLANAGSVPNLVQQQGVASSTPTQVPQSPVGVLPSGPSPSSAAPSGPNSGQSLAPSPAASAVSSTNQQNDSNSSNPPGIVKTDTS